MKKFTSIKWKISSLILATVICMMAVTIIATYHVVSNVIKEKSVDEMDTISELIANYLVPSLQFFDVEGARSIINESIKTESIDRICLYDINQTLLHESKVDNKNKCSNTVSETMGHENFNLSDYLNITRIKDKNQETQGYIIVEASFKQIPEIMKILKKNYIIITFFVILMSALLAYFLHPVISSRIVDLSKFTIRVSQEENQAERFSDKQNDEIAVLAQNLNQLLDIIQKQKDILVEEKVKSDKANQAKTEFLTNMSHELRTPMHSIINFTEIVIGMIEKDGNEKAAKYLTNVNKSANRLLNLLNDLLDLAKMQTNKMEYHFDSTDVESCYQDCVDELSSLISSKNINMKKEVTGTKGEIDADYQRLQQVFINVISNALKFTDNDKSITVHIDYSHNDKINIDFQDEGIGISENELETIFDEFSQSSLTKTGAGGTGLGLSICRRIIMAHHGTIHAKNNEKGSGCTISIELPKQQPEKA